MYKARKVSLETIQAMLNHFSSPNSILGLRATLEINDPDQDVKALLQALRVTGILKDVKGQKRSLTCVVDTERLRAFSDMLAAVEAAMREDNDDLRTVLAERTQGDCYVSHSGKEQQHRLGTGA